MYELCIYLHKNGLGYFLGDFFTNSSGHPDASVGGMPCGFTAEYGCTKSDKFRNLLQNQGKQTIVVFIIISGANPTTSQFITTYNASAVLGYVERFSK
jgi:hypothetical protein